MIYQIQKLCHDFGEAGCYELSIVCAGEMEMGFEFSNPLAFHVKNMETGRVASDCIVLDAGAIMAVMCGGKWVCLKAGIGRDSAGRQYDLPLDYVLRPGEHDIHRYERKVQEAVGVQKVTVHFFYAGPGDLWDSMGESLTRMKGELVSRRILRRVS